MPFLSEFRGFDIYIRNNKNIYRGKNSLKHRQRLANHDGPVMVLEQLFKGLS